MSKMSSLKYSLNIQYFAEGDEQEDKTKAALDKATKEAAEWKRKYNEKLSDEEKQKEAAEYVALCSVDTYFDYHIIPSYLGYIRFIQTRYGIVFLCQTI